MFMGNAVQQVYRTRRCLAIPSSREAMKYKGKIGRRLAIG